MSKRPISDDAKAAEPDEVAAKRQKLEDTYKLTRAVVTRVGSYAATEGYSRKTLRAVLGGGAAPEEIVNVGAVLEGEPREPNSSDVLGAALSAVNVDPVYGRFLLGDHAHGTQQLLASISETPVGRWPPDSPASARAAFVISIGGLSNTCHPMSIIRFLDTLDGLIDRHSPHLFGNARLLLKSDCRKTMAVLDANLHFTGTLDPAVIADGPMGLLTTEALVAYIADMRGRLRHAFNVSQLVVHSVATGNVTGLPLIKTFDPPLGDSADELKDAQKLLHHAFNTCAARGLRKKGDVIYEPIFTDDGTNTRCFRRLSEISEYVYTICGTFDALPEMYSILTSTASMPDYITKFLTNLTDTRLPTLVKDRTLFSFNNGIFNARDATLYMYRPTAVMLPGTRAISELPDGISTSKYFDAPLQPTWVNPDLQPILIQTPYCDKILRTQHYDDNDVTWFYALLGRNVFDVGDLDGWQTSLYVQGVAGSGKSTLLRLYSGIYDATDVGFLCDDSEPTFCDQHLLNANIVMALDVGASFQLSSTRFNSWCGGEEVIVNRKFLTAITIKWRATVVMASNVPPPIQSRAGSGARRIVQFQFSQPVRDSDPGLDAKCAAELPALLVKTVRMYLDKVRLHGNEGLWDKSTTLPEQCQRARRAYLAASCPLAGFFASEYVTYDDDAVTSSADLRRVFAAYMEANAGGGKRLPTATLFTAMGLSEETARYGCKWSADGREPVEPAEGEQQPHKPDVILPTSSTAKVYGIALTEIGLEALGRRNDAQAASGINPSR